MVAGALLAVACAPAAAPAQPTAPAQPKAMSSASPAAQPAASPAVAGSPAAQAAASSVDMDGLYQRAQREGTVLWYTTFPLDEATPIAEAFSRKYPGVRIEIFRGTGTSVVQRFETEYAANQARSDVVQIANLDPMLKWQRDGWLLEHSLPEAAQIPDRWKQQGQWYMEAVVVSCMAYNTTAIAAGEVPNRFDALVDPKWAGKVGVLPPWATGAALEHAYYMQIRTGIADWPTRLEANKPLLFNTTAELTQAVGRGEVAIGAPVQEYDVPRFKRQGAPIECIYPRDEVPMTVRPATIPKNAPHPNGAQLFLNWRLSDEGQTLMQENIGQRSVRQGMPNPPGLPRNEELNIFLPDPAEIEKYRAEVLAGWERHFR